MLFIPCCQGGWSYIGGSGNKGGKNSSGGVKYGDTYGMLIKAK